jgi:hypothetical protein
MPKFGRIFANRTFKELKDLNKVFDQMRSQERERSERERDKQETLDNRAPAKEPTPRADNIQMMPQGRLQ